VSDTWRISVVDDDASMREAIRGLLRSAGFEAEVFASAEEFLTSGRLSDTTCLVLDVRMPGMSGIELQERLVASGHAVPIIFVTAHADEDERARALDRGAVDCLRKPFSDDALLDAIAKANGAKTNGATSRS
jgi:FixJ family two-component response regulator